MKTLNINILRCIITTGRGMDRVSLEVDLSDPIDVNSNLSFDFKAPKGKGEDFVKNVLRISEKDYVVRYEEEPDYKFSNK